MSGHSNIMVQRTIYQMALMTLVATLVWVGMGILQASNKPVEIEVEKELLEPINPAIDREIIQQLMVR